MTSKERVLELRKRNKCQNCGGDTSTSDPFRNVAYCKRCLDERLKKYRKKHQCIDCGTDIPIIGRGQVPHRCNECKDKRTKDVKDKWLSDHADSSRIYARTAQARYRKEHPDDDAYYAMFRRYGVTRTMFDNTWEQQTGQCAICHKILPSLFSTKDKRRNLHIDHDHATGKFRGLLCGQCNLMLGLVADSKETLTNAIEYLKISGNQCPP